MPNPNTTGQRKLHALYASLFAVIVLTVIALTGVRPTIIEAGYDAIVFALASFMGGNSLEHWSKRGGKE